MRKNVGWSRHWGPEKKFNHGEALERRLEVINWLRGSNYRLRKVCPHCAAALEARDILAGFKHDPREFTTRCPMPECQQRFQPLIVYKKGDNPAEVPFYGPAQLAPQLPTIQPLSPAELAETHPVIYHSAILHWGSLQAAFASNGLPPYPHREIANWQEGVRPLLASVPSSILATCAEMPVTAIRAYARELGIRAPGAEKQR
ncbi:MAG TPA: hypothetical protein VJA27_04205 [Patescibacteria group bacterium]|nr:hypothetical protein [Patescibacteria group bacterium]